MTISAPISMILNAIREMAGHDVSISATNVYERGHKVAAIFFDGMVYDETEQRIVLSNWEVSQLPQKGKK